MTGAVFEPATERLPLPRRGKQQQWCVERDRRNAGLLDRAGVLPDTVVQALVVVAALVSCGRLSGARSPGRASCQRRLDERVNERTRIARELHDTLLQSFHGLLLRSSRPRRTAAGAPGRAKKWMVRLNTRRRRSPKAGTRSGLARVDRRTQRSRGRDQDPWRRARDPRERRPAAHIQCRSRGPDARDLHRSFVTRSTRLRRKPFAMPSGTRMPGGSRSRSATTTSNSDCACATMAGDRSGGARKPGSRGTLRPARHAGTRGTDRRETGGVERSRRRDGGGAAPSASIVYATSPRRSWWSRLLAPRRRHSRGDAS